MRSPISLQDTSFLYDDDGNEPHGAVPVPCPAPGGLDRRCAGRRNARSPSSGDSTGNHLIKPAGDPGLVLTAVALGAALVQGVVSTMLRRVLPYVQQVSALLLVAAGSYILWTNLPLLVA